MNADTTSGSRHEDANPDEATRVGDVAGRQTRIEEKFAFLEHDIEALADAVQTLTTRIDALERSALHRHAELHQRIELLETESPDESMS